MQLTAKLKNKATLWSANLKPRVLDVVSDSGYYYVNISGVNGALTDTAHWFQWPVGVGTAIVVEVNKTAADIGGADPDFTMDLSAAGLPSFPSSVMVYVDLEGSGDWEPVSAIYNPVTGTLHGLNSPTTYPDMLIKVKAV